MQNLSVSEQPKRLTKKNESAVKVIKIIEAMSRRRGPVRLQDIARDSGLPTSTTIRFLNSLIELGYVQQQRETARYALTLKLCRVAGDISQNTSYRDVVRPYMEELTERLSESSCMAVMEGAKALYVDVVDAPDQLLKTLQRIGKSAPLHSTGVGKCLLLGLASRERRSLLEQTPLVRLTEHTHASMESLERDLELSRKRGYALDDEECELGVRCVAAPVSDHSGNIVASISISGPSSRITPKRIDQIASDLIETARVVSRALGAPV